MTVLMDVARPEPQPEQELVVRQTLRDIDPLLDLKWFPHAAYCPRTKTLEGRYALVCTWPQADKRWQDFQQGKIDLPVDIIGWLTDAAGEGDFFETERLPVDPLELLPRIIEHLGRMDNTRQDWSLRMKQVALANAQQRLQVKQLAQEEMLDGLMYYHKYFLGEPVVNLNSGQQLERVPLPSKTRL